MEQNNPTMSEIEIEKQRNNYIVDMVEQFINLLDITNINNDFFELFYMVFDMCSKDNDLAHRYIKLDLAKFFFVNFINDEQDETIYLKQFQEMEYDKKLEYYNRFHSVFGNHILKQKDPYFIFVMDIYLLSSLNNVFKTQNYLDINIMTIFQYLCSIQENITFYFMLLHYNQYTDFQHSDTITWKMDNPSNPIEKVIIQEIQYTDELKEKTRENEITINEKYKVKGDDVLFSWDTYLFLFSKAYDIDKINESIQFYKNSIERILKSNEQYLKFVNIDDEFVEKYLLYIPIFVFLMDGKGMLKFSKQ